MNQLVIGRLVQIQEALLILDGRHRIARLRHLASLELNKVRRVRRGALAVTEKEWTRHFASLSVSLQTWRVDQKDKTLQDKKD